MLKNYEENSQLKVLNLLHPKWVPQFLVMNNASQFITSKLRELNKLCKAAQVIDKKNVWNEINWSSVLFLMYSINSNQKTCILIITSQYSVHQSGALLWRHGLYTKAYTFWVTYFQVLVFLWTWIYIKVWIKGYITWPYLVKHFFFTRKTYIIKFYFLKFNKGTKRPGIRKWQ